jgi:4-amino-4-deoxy-L-arabinose transferase-like glycosyltransferase
MKPLGRIDRLLAGTVLLLTLGTLMTASRTQGNTRDEGQYFDAAELYYGWYGELGDNLLKGQPQKSFSRASVERWFSYNHEHPALMKTLSGFSWRIFHKCKCKGQGGHSIGYSKPHRTLGLLSEEAALRLPAQLSVALMAMLIFLFGAATWSRAAGLVAAVLTVAAPRLFFDAQLACFDAPIAALWVATVYAYWRALDDGKWAWRTGVLFGLALATKHNAFFLPFILLAHYLWVHRETLRRLKLPPIPRVFLWMALVGPLVYLACWPWLWFDTVARFKEYVAFHVHHVYYNMEYLGRNYNKPPFPISYPYVMTLLTLPVTTLALAIGGGVALLRRFFRKTDLAFAATVEVPIGMFKAGETLKPTSRRPAAGMSTAPGLLVGLNALFPMAILTVTRAPIFGATKHFHAAIPFLALLAGFGYQALCERLPEKRRALIAAALGVLVCLPATLETARSHPYGLTHYNLLAGGPPGGADLGMNRQFWGYATRGLLPWLNQHAQPSAPVYWHDTNQAQLNMWVREGLLRPDLRNTGLEEPGVKASDLALVIHEKHFNKYEYWIWDFYGTARPSVVLDDEGVPIVTLYERPKGK